MRTEIVSQSTGYPLTIIEVKDHLRIPTGETDEDDYLYSLLNTATEKVEKICAIKLRYQTHKLYIDDWPNYDCIELPFYPLKSVPSTGIVYKKSDGTSTTFSSTAWTADTISEPGRVCLEYNDSWPTATLHNVNPISIEFNCGSTSSTGIPNTIKHALKLAILDWYENREDQVIVRPGESIHKLPQGVMDLLAFERRQWV